MDFKSVANISPFILLKVFEVLLNRFNPSSVAINNSFSFKSRILLTELLDSLFFPNSALKFVNCWVDLL